MAASQSDVVRTSDETALLPVSLGTGVWIVALVTVGLTVGVAPVEGQVWWFAVTVIGTLSGAFGLVFLRWRRQRVTYSSTAAASECAPQP